MIPVFKQSIELPGIGSSIRIYFIGDVHAGSRHIREERLAEDIDRIATEGAYWFGMGDMGDWIYYSDKRFDYYEQAKWLDLGDPYSSTSKWVCKTFAPIKGKCLGFIEGNHEDTVRKRYHQYVQQWLCNDLGVLNLGDTAWVPLMFNRTKTSKESVQFYLTHGFGGGRTPGARVNKLEWLMSDNHAQVYAMGHVHGSRPLLVRAKRALTARLQPKVLDMVGLITGTYLGDAEYSRRWGSSPSVIGGVYIDIWPYDHRIRASSEARY